MTILTSDIKTEWLPVIYKARGGCGNNNGFALVTISTPIVGSVPVPINKDGDAADELEPGWLSVIRHLQASSSKNAGLSMITLSVAVVSRSPVIWGEAEISPIETSVHINKIRPMKVKAVETAENLVEAVACFLH